MVAVLEELAPLEWRDFLSHQGLVQGWPSALAFHPKTNMLATLGDHDSVIRVWDLQLDVLLGAETSIISGHYANAKVVLVGDTGVGKTALAQVLTGKPFAPTESTQGRHVWTLEVQNVETEVGTREVRETLLWDLAGQPGYRLVHQLHLGEVAIALVVFDARSEIDPFGGVRYWARALRQAQFAHLSSAKIIKILVAARTDVAGISASRERINSFVKDCGFDAYFETSALTGRNIDELSEAIRSAIHWEDMVRVSSTALFQQIKTFLLEEKKTERLLSGEDDLYRTFLKVKGTQAEITDLSSQFAACVGRLEASGLVRRLGFGGLLLLQPEVLDAYASAIVSAAKDEPDGLGSISEATARVGNLELSVRERITDPAKERLLLIATIEDLLRHEIALREQGVDGPYLVFPTQFTRQKSELPVPESGSVIFTFGGAVINIYATLAVRLSHSGLFSKKEMWKNAAFYTAGVGGTCGMFIREVDEGSGELILLFDTAASEETRFNFEEYVRAHLERRAISETIRRRRIFVCSVCSTPVTELQDQRRRERDFNWLFCSVCGERVSLLDREDRLSSKPHSTIFEMDRAAEVQREANTAISVLEGKIATSDFDVFLAYHHADGRQVEAVAEKLRKQGLNPWLDVEQIPPGQSFQAVIERDILRVRSAAIFFGLNGLGAWQTAELRTLVSRCVERKLPVIPVLLPGVISIPTELLFLHELRAVRFVSSVDENEIINQLVWGITVARPEKLARAEMRS